MIQTAAAAFARRLAIVSPHPDDETLGCGALMASLRGTHDVHVLFATDGARSPEPPGGDAAARAELRAVREQEAVDAMAVLGIPSDRLHFLRFPDGDLRARQAPLQRALVDRLSALGIEDVLVPFRYDWHPDHVAVHRAAAAAVRARAIDARLVEYFVYTQRRLLRHGDVRAYVRPARAIRVAPDTVAGLKLEALRCFRSQTTRYFDWQRRPILTPELLRRMCAAPEAFVAYDPRAGAVLRGAAWIRVASALEPPLKRAKDGVLSWLGA